MTDPDEMAIRARRARWIAAAMAGVSSTGCQSSAGSEPAASNASSAIAPSPTAGRSEAPPSNPKDEAVQEALARDTDKDGIRDFRDKCPDIPGVDQPDREGCPPTPCLSIVAPTTPVLLVRIAFEAHRADVETNWMAILDEIAQAMTDQSTWTLRIVGHCRSDEPAVIAARRAEAVQRELERRGIARERLEPISESCSPKAGATSDATTVSFEIIEAS